MRIAFGGIHTECSTYSQLVQDRSDFTVQDGADLAGHIGLETRSDVDLVPLFFARSLPGGPIAATTYNTFKKHFLEQFSAALPLDGVLLIMHGAMHVVGMDDAEGDWISSVRDFIGAEMPLAVSYDLHGNITQKIADAIDIFAAYRTAPHIDVKETHNRALGMLENCLRTSIRPMVGWAQIPVLLPGERTSTEDEPARSLYATLRNHDTVEGVLDANLLVGYVWADTPRATAAAIVTGTRTDAVTKSVETIASAYWQARNLFRFGVKTGTLDQCLDLVGASTSFPVVLADSGDNPTGGGVGDRADILHEFLRRNLTDAVFAGIADAPAALAAEAAGEGANLMLSIGGSLGSAGPIVTSEARVLEIIGNRSRNSLQVMVEIASNRVILSQTRRPYHSVEDFQAFGIEPDATKIIVVKSGYLSPELAPIAGVALMALTDGAVNQDIPTLGNNLRPQPTYPFRSGFEWKAQCFMSARTTRV